MRRDVPQAHAVAAHADSRGMHQLFHGRGSRGNAALAAEDGASGLEIFRSDRRIDLLLSDVGLPGAMNGRQMADAARQTLADLKVLFITGYAEKATVGNGHIKSGMHVMTKAVRHRCVATRIKQLIAGSERQRAVEVLPKSRFGSP